MAEQDPNLNLIYGWEFRESGWKPGMDANLKKLGAITQLAALAITNDPPAAPADGDRHIIGIGTGVWAGKDNQIAVRVAGAWEYYAPAEGWLCSVKSIGEIQVFSSGSWAALKIDGGIW